jgi:hypothetical protein
VTDSLSVRHHDADLDAFAARVTHLLLERPPLLVDLSEHDERCDRIKLRVLDLGESRDQSTS